MMEMVTREALIMGTADIVGIVVGLAILYGMLFENRNDSDRSRAFVVCLVLTEISLLSDAFGWLLDGRHGMDVFLRLVNLVAVSSSSLVFLSFSFYELETLREKTELPAYLLSPVIILTLLTVLFNIVGFHFGYVFTVEDGVFMMRKGYYLGLYTSLLSFFYMFFLTSRYRRELGRHDVAAFFTYYFIPLTAALAELIPPNLEFALSSSVLSLLIVYIMLQSGRISEMQIRQEFFEEFSYRDSLTGLKNRRAYEETLSTLMGGKRFAVIFCDVNGLKYMNDTFGHVAGDQHLLRFAEVMTKHLPKENCYRISGDEFLALFQDADPAEITQMAESLRKEVADLEDLASIGVARGMTESATGVISQAEREMYDEKTLFYIKYPSYDMRRNRVRNE